MIRLLSVLLISSIQVFLFASCSSVPMAANRVSLSPLGGGGVETPVRVAVVGFNGTDKQRILVEMEIVEQDDQRAGFELIDRSMTDRIFAQLGIPRRLPVEKERSRELFNRLQCRYLLTFDVIRWSVGENIEKPQIDIRYRTYDSRGAKVIDSTVSREGGAGTKLEELLDGIVSKIIDTIISE